MSKNVKRALSLLISLSFVFSVAAIGSPCISVDTLTNTATQRIEIAGNAVRVNTDAAVPVPASVSQPESDGEGCSCEHNPFIVVPGITDSDVALLDAQGNPVIGSDGKPYVKGGFMIDEDEIIDTALKTLALPLAKMLITQKDNGFTDAVYKTAKSAFWRQATNKDGTPVENLEVVRYEKSFAELTEEEINHLFINIPLRGICDIIGYDHVYYFAFNIIGDPMETARELDQFIQMVKQQTGHDKVNILNASLGASIFTAYAEQYKDKGDVEKVVNIVALLNGSLILRDLYAGNFDLSDEALYRDFFPAILANGDSKAMGYLVNLLIRVLPRQVLLDTFDAVLNGAMDAMLRHAPNFWAMVPKEDYPALADKWLSGAEYAVMRAKADAFYQAQLNLEDNMLYMINEKGAEINNVCGYNLKFSDMTNILTMVNSDKTINSDGVIHVQSTALGVTAAPAGQQLPAEYLAAHAGSKYISPDKGLDASTCVLPDNTWFFYNQDHEQAGKNAACMNLVGELFTNPDFVNINSDPARFPQFNIGSDSKEIRRTLLPEAQKVLALYAKGEFNISAADLAELNAAIAQAEDALKATIGDQAVAAAATQRLKNILIKIGYRSAPPPAVEPDPVKVFFTALLDKVLKAASELTYQIVGPQGYSDRF